MEQGPLRGVRVVELAGLGPAPFACMMLADMGADVLRLDRPGPAASGLPPGPDVLRRGRPALSVDLKHPEARRLVLDLVEQADVLVEGYRPGVAERLGVGPDSCLTRNPRLVYARMTGWGQDGPLADRVGHDINYLAMTGALAAVGEPARKPVPPLNLVADFGGGAMFLLAGVLAALVERSTSGRGQVVDAAMVDGVSSLLAMTYSLRHAGLWRDERGTNLLDGGAPFYDTYACSDGGYLAVGALEPQFWSSLLDTLTAAGEVTASWPDQHDVAHWPQLRAALGTAFGRKTRDEWAALFATVDACVSPVLTVTEAAEHAHLRSRRTVEEIDGMTQPAAAPRWSRTPGQAHAAPQVSAATVPDVLASWGVGRTDADRLCQAGVICAP